MVTFGFQWLDSTGKVIHNDRSILLNVLMPESSVAFDVNVPATSKPGDYTLRYSMVQELVAWFCEKGAALLIVKIKVE
jgi:hypothetical protein